MHFLLYNEKKRHGTADFPVAYYFVNEEHPRYSMPFHWHREWELIRVLSGAFLLNVNGKEYAARAGDVFLLPEGALHGGAPQQGVYECLNFDLEELCGHTPPVRGLLRPFFRGLYVPTVYYPKENRVVPPLVEEVLAAMTGDMPHEAAMLQTVAALYRLFAGILAEELYTKGDSTKALPNSIDQLKPVLEYIEANFQQPLSLAQLAAVIGMNPKYFCRFFHQATQQTPMNYVNMYRVEQAAHMLCSTAMTVTEVGLECGFSDTSHFVKIFKKHKGITPKQFRKREE